MKTLSYRVSQDQLGTKAHVDRWESRFVRYIFIMIKFDNLFYKIIYFGWPLEIHFNLLTKNEFCHGIPAQNPSARCKICRTKY